MGQNLAEVWRAVAFDAKRDEHGFMLPDPDQSTTRPHTHNGGQAPSGILLSTICLQGHQSLAIPKSIAANFVLEPILARLL